MVTLSIVERGSRPIKNKMRNDSFYFFPLKRPKFQKGYRVIGLGLVLVLVLVSKDSSPNFVRKLI